MSTSSLLSAPSPVVPVPAVRKSPTHGCPDPSLKNAKRMILAYRPARERGVNVSHFQQDTADCFTDALTDLRHYADDMGVDFYQALQVSYRHYLSEKQS